MNDEEKKTFEFVKNCLKTGNIEDFQDIDKYDIETLLSLISKLQKENKELSEKMVDKICKGIEEEVLEEYREKINKLQKELDKILEE